MRFRRGFENQQSPPEVQPQAAPASPPPAHVRVSAGGAPIEPAPSSFRRRQFSMPAPESAPSARARPSVSSAQAPSASGMIAAGSRRASASAAMMEPVASSRRRQLPQVAPAVEAPPVSVPSRRQLPQVPPDVAAAPAAPSAPAPAVEPSVAFSGSARRRQHVDPQASAAPAMNPGRHFRGAESAPVGISSGYRRQLPQSVTDPSVVQPSPDPVAAARSHMVSTNASARVRGVHGSTVTELSGVNARRRQMVQSGPDVDPGTMVPASMAQANANARRSAFERFLADGAASAAVDPEIAKQKAAADLEAARAAMSRRSLPAAEPSQDLTVQVVQVTIPSSEIRKIAEDAVAKAASSAAAAAVASSAAASVAATPPAAEVPSVVASSDVSDLHEESIEIPEMSAEESEDDGSEDSDSDESDDDLFDIDEEDAGDDNR